MRVTCERCGESISYEREMQLKGRTLCRSCGGAGYYTVPTVLPETSSARQL